MKKSQAAIVGLLLAGTAVGIKFGIDAPAARSSVSFNASGGQSTSGLRIQPKSRSVANDEERVQILQAWLDDKDRTPSWKRFREMANSVRGLSIEEIQRFLNDPKSLADVGDPNDPSRFPRSLYPHRVEIRRLLWSRLGELAPNLALDLAFPDGQPNPDSNVQIRDILLGVSQSEPRLAFETWRLHYSKSTSQDEIAISWMIENWAKTSPEEAITALGSLPAETRPSAYTGYIIGLGGQADWANEAKRFDRLFPDTRERTLESQTPSCHLAAQWAIADPDAAFAWVATLPKGDSSGNFMGYMQVIATWMREEPTDSTAWLKSWAPPGFEKDHLYAEIFKGHGDDDIPVSTAALELIDSQALRDQLVRYTISGDKWASRDLFRSWEKSPRLSPEVRSEVTRIIQERDEKGSGWRE
jgi:hypothetical protein